MASSARRERRFGPITMESLLVVALLGVIAGASVLVNRIDPGRHETRTTVGSTTYQTKSFGGGGVQPGEIQARTIAPVHVAASDQLSGVTAAPTPKPPKPVKSTPTAAPTAPGTVSTGTSTGTGAGGGTTTPTTGGATPKPGGNPTGGTKPCTNLLGLGCPKGTATG